MNRTDRPAACSDFLDVFSDFVDGTLPPDRKGEIHAHLDCCEGCLRHLAAYRRGVMALKASERDVDPATFWAALERRLWTEGNLAGGRADDSRIGAGWRHPAVAVAVAACFAVVVFFAGMWGDHALHDARSTGDDRPVVVRASAFGERPLVVESEPIPVATMNGRAARAPDERRNLPAEPAVEPDVESARVVRASLDVPPAGSGEAVGEIDRDAEAAYVASLERELAAWEAIERTRESLPRNGLRGAWSGSRVSDDGWVAPVRLGNAGVRTLQANGPVTPWTLEAAISLP
ncbi:MAG: zf-HC2 domain-containing protein [Gemmatimonadetes bacterium]|nr:zf-HC2 domain-containing protein [Gemmatimonadota bacterium]